MKISELQAGGVTDELVDRILFEGLERREPRPVDVAIVLGSSKAHLYRLPPAVEAYRAGNVKTVVVSGHTREMNGEPVNEGEFLRARALEMGVRKADILVESRARNTWENLAFSRELLERRGLLTPGLAIAIATSSWHMRRSLCLAERMFARDRVALVPLVGIDRTTNRATWFKSEKGRKRCYGEVEKLIAYAREGLIDDWEL